MAAPAPLSTLTCKECGYANEPERVYCHNCGAKLDRSVLPKEDQMRREPPEKARRRIMRMTNPGAGPVKRALSNLAKAVAYALLAALVITALRPPPEVPPAKGPLSTRMVSTELLEVMSATQPKTATVAQTDINNFLGAAHANKPGLIPGVKYARSFVNLEPGAARITLERSFWGFSMYFGTIYRVEANSGVLTAVNVGGYIGRLPIYPALWQYLEPFLLKDIRETFSTEIKQLQQAGYLRVDKGQVTFTNNKR